MTIIIRSVFEEDGQLYPRFFLKALCMNYRNSISGGIDTIKTSASKECMLCHYWYFKDVQFRFEPYVCNKCDNVLMTAYELKSVAVENVKVVGFRYILWGISRDEAVNKPNNSVLEDKGVL